MSKITWQIIQYNSRRSSGPKRPVKNYLQREIAHKVSFGGYLMCPHCQLSERLEGM